MKKTELIILSILFVITSYTLYLMFFTIPDIVLFKVNGYDCGINYSTHTEWQLITAAFWILFAIYLNIDKND